MSRKKNKQAFPIQETIPEPVTVPEEMDGADIVREVMEDLPLAEPVRFPLREKKHIPLTHRTWAKVIVFILTILFAAARVSRPGSLTYL